MVANSIAIRKEGFHNLLNAVLFQACWYVCIFQGGYLPLIPFMLLLVHFLLSAKFRWGEAGIVFLVLCAGWSFDAMAAMAGAYRFPNWTPGLQVLPLWLLIVWAGFSLTVTRSLSWLLERPKLLFVGMTVSGPFSYWVGRKAGAISFDDWYLMVMAVFWAVLACMLYAYKSWSESEIQVAENHGHEQI